MKIAFQTLGCKVNQYETEALMADFRKMGYEIAIEGVPADVYIINTCTVTGMSDRKSRQYIRRAKRESPESVVAVTGCYAHLRHDEVIKIEGVDIVAGNTDKMSLPGYIEEFLSARGSGSKAGCQKETGVIAPQESRTRAHIKIQDGCDRFCAYCIVPFARGGLFSKPLNNIISEAESLINSGYRELVLVGINTALYDDKGIGLTGVIDGLNSLSGDFRIRLSSLEPTVVDAEYVKSLFKYGKLCLHLHLSLQSGSDRVLGLMKRNYDMREYMEIIGELKAFDECYGISTDVIAGFPGESEDDFLKSVLAIREVNFCKAHVFKYSDRKGTAASAMGEKVGGDEKKRRSEALIKEASESAERFFRRCLGRKTRVLIEEYDKETGCYTGYSDNYIKTYIEKEDGGGYYLNRFVSVKPKELYKDGMKAEINDKE